MRRVHDACPCNARLTLKPSFTRTRLGFAGRILRQGNPRMRRLMTFLSTVAAAAAVSVPALAGSISVPIDQSRVVTFKKPVSTVFVGNPTMGDVSVIDSRHAFVLGKAFGVTNLLALDAQGNVVANDRLTVYGHTADVVTLNRGANQFTYACADKRCEAAPVPGDTQPYYTPVMGENQQRQQMGQQSAVASAAQ